MSVLPTHSSSSTLQLSTLYPLSLELVSGPPEKNDALMSLMPRGQQMLLLPLSHCVTSFTTGHLLIVSPNILTSQSPGVWLLVPGGILLGAGILLMACLCNALCWASWLTSGNILHAHGMILT